MVATLAEFDDRAVPGSRSTLQGSVTLRGDSQSWSEDCGKIARQGSSTTVNPTLAGGPQGSISTGSFWRKSDPTQSPKRNHLRDGSPFRNNSGLGNFAVALVPVLGYLLVP